MPKTKKINTDLSIIIPVAGLGRRMKSHGNKCLIEINKETILKRQLRIVSEQYPTAEIIVVAGFQADRIIKNVPSYVKIIENDLYETTNTARSISMALRAINYKNKALVINGDLIFNEETIQDIGLYEQPTVIIDSCNRFSIEEVGVLINKDKVVNFSYGNIIKWAQIMLLDAKSIHIFSNILLNKERHKFHTFEILNMLIDKSISFNAVEPNGMKIAEIDCYQDIEKAKNI